MRRFKYLMVFTLPATVLVSFTSEGFLAFLPLIYSFMIIPFLELFFTPVEGNEHADINERSDGRLFDWMLYMVVPVQYGFLIFFLFSMSNPELSSVSMVGRITAMGLLCGVLGINVAHELGHRSDKKEQTLAKMLLLTSLYMHFFIEHNRGHHKRVSTLEDPNSARKGEVLYFFWVRSSVFAWISAWQISFQDMEKAGRSKFSLSNEMLQFQLVQSGFCLLIAWLFGWPVMLYFIAAATFGFLLLETVNYIEHYGLQREKNEKGQYERVRPAHSWNSNHLLGRSLLFELSRHSDHHFLANRKYQTLRHMEDSPQMPTGYPGMMLLSVFPPFWFLVIHRVMKKQGISQ